MDQLLHKFALLSEHGYQAASKGWSDNNSYPFTVCDLIDKTPLADFTLIDEGTEVVLKAAGGRVLGRFNPDDHNAIFKAIVVRTREIIDSQTINR